MLSPQDHFLAHFEKYSDELYRYACFRVRDPQLAQDLLQITFEKWWLSLRGGKSVEHVRPFLYRMLSNVIADHFRRKQSTSLDQLMEGGFDPSVDSHEAAAQTHLDFETAQKAIAKLPSQYAEVIALRFLQDLSISELAERLLVSENVAAVRLTRALKKLRTFLPSSYDFV